MKKIFIICFLYVVSFIGNIAVVQAQTTSADPSITSAAFSPGVMKVGEQSVFKCDFANQSTPGDVPGGDIPARTFNVKISFPNECNPFPATIAAVAAGAGINDWFDWTYDPVKHTLTGTNNRVIPEGDGGQIIVNVMGMADSKGNAVKTVASIQVFEDLILTSDDYTNNTKTPTCKVNPAVLPITLTSFTAQKAANSSALVKWSITDAKNFSHFELERSSSGRLFSKIVTIAFEEKKAAYTYTDENLQAGSYQYRLKMVDIDGKIKYSEVRSLSFDGSVNEKIYIAPNPTKGEFFVRGVTANALVRVLDINGKTLQTYNGVNAYTTLNVGQLPAAVYIVQVIQNGQLSGTYKLIKE